MEREYARLRDAEARYRLLFQISSEAVLIVDGASRKVVEANPAADALIGGAGGPLVGKPFAKLFDSESHDSALALLTVVQSTSRTKGAQSALASGAGALTVSASLFRQDRAEYFLVRLTPQKAQQEATVESASRLLDVLEGLPEAFVVTDESLNILAENAAFLDLVRLASKEQARGQSLARFLGRSAVDRNILIANLREHGSVRNFGTVMTNQLQDQEEVEVTAVHAPDAYQPCFGFTIRRAARRADARANSLPELGRSVEQLTELVGRVSLKDLVRETTDLVERLCIEAALELTGNNRASAAQVLGLSRQSLYSKLGRFDLGNPAIAE
jgi:transcriptional regulator PpsR